MASRVEDRGDPASAGFTASSTPASLPMFWTRLRFWILLAALSVLPFLLAPVPPLTDYPGHLARFHVMLELAHSPDLQRFYTFHWMLVGNLGTDLLVYPLGLLLGAERAGWIVAAAIPPLTVLGIYAAARAAHGEVQPTTFLALLFVYSPPFLWGFLNFSLSIALALFAFALWVGWRWRWRAPAFLLIGILVWLCHASGWGVLGLMIAGYEWQRTRSLAGTAMRLVPLGFPVLLMLGSPHPAGGSGPYTLAYKASIYLLVLQDRSLEFDLLCTAGLLGFLLWAVRSHRARFDAALGLPALLVLAASLVVHRGFFGGDLADLRLVPVAGLLGLAALRWRGSSSIAVPALAFVGLRLAVTATGWHSDSEALQRHLLALDAVPHGARVLALVPFGAPGEALSQHDHSYLAGYAVVRRDAFTNSNFSLPGLHMMGVRRSGRFSAAPSQRLDLAGSGTKLSETLASISGRDFDYVWIMGTTRPVMAPAWFQLRYRDDETALFRVQPDQFVVAPEQRH